MNIWKKDVDEKELGEMVKELSENITFQYQIIVTFGDCNFEKFDIRTTITDFDKIVSGRIFGKDAELRFRRISDTIFRTVVISERELSNLEGVETKDLESSCKSYYLWGEQLDEKKTWFEARIPRLLHYPLDNPKELVKLKTVEYKNRESGFIEFTRFQEIVGEDY